MNLNQITLACADYGASVDFYRALGLRLIVDSPPRYARFETGSGSTISVHKADKAGASSGTVIYFEVDDVDSTVQEFEQAGLEFESQPTDQTWLWREAYLLDPAGNRICIYHAGANRRYPPWRVPDDK